MKENTKKILKVIGTGIGVSAVFALSTKSAFTLGQINGANAMKHASIASGVAEEALPEVLKAINLKL